MIKTSIIIPVYNTAEYLRECLDSVLNQTQKEIEIILIDDGSDDGSLEICREYADRYPFITLLQQDHLYQGTARNRGLEIARGRYIYFMDSDDWITPGLLEKCYDKCEERGLDFVIFDAHGFVYDENDHELVIPEDIYDRLPMGIEDRNYTGPEFWNTFYNRHGVLYVCWLHYIRKEFLLDNHLFYEEKTYFEDNDWILRMYLNAENLYFIPEQLHMHRWRRGSNMLGGFTVGLLEGCFRMHDVLLRIWKENADPEKRKMIRDVIRLNIQRFRRLREVKPVPAYTEPLAGFCEYLKALIRDSRVTDDLFDFHVQTAGEIIGATEDWHDSRFGSGLEKEIRDAVGKHYLLGVSGRRVAIYGTGIVSERFLQHYQKTAGEIRAEVVFLNTDEPAEKEFHGYPVICVRDAAGWRPDCVLIASTKYGEEMWETVRQFMGDDMLCRMIR
ncbi:MAG: glycosyltransferase [Solobacterium sp.]|nr:glycosyltransferase [Solobacterium sp.]